MFVGHTWKLESMISWVFGELWQICLLLYTVKLIKGKYYEGLHTFMWFGVPSLSLKQLKIDFV